MNPTTALPERRLRPLTHIASAKLIDVMCDPTHVDSVAARYEIGNRILDLEAAREELRDALRAMLAEHICGVHPCPNPTCAAFKARALLARLAGAK